MRTRPGPSRLRHLAPLLLLALQAACAKDGLARLREPADVSAQTVEDGILVTWTDMSDGEDGHRVYRQEVESGNPVGDPEEVGTTGPDEESFLDTTGEQGKTYTYAVTAFKGDVESSAAEQEGPPVGPPPSPEPEPEPDGIIEVTSLSGGTGGPACTLRDAIAAADTDTATGGCEAGIGADVILLPAGVITLTEVHGDTDGPTGLPSVTTEVEVRGALALEPVGGGDGGGSPTTTVARADDAPPFRLFHVAASGSLTLSGVNVEGGYLEGGSSGAGMYVAGAATLITVAFTGNEAQGADGGALAAAGATLDLDAVDFTGNVVGPDDGAFTGAAIHLVGSQLDHELGTLTGNRGSFAGGSAVVYVDADSEANLRDVDIVDNEAAGVWNLGQLGFFDGSIRSSANELEGGLLNEGEGLVENSEISGNVAQHTGGVYNTGTLDIGFSTIEDNEVLAEEAGLAGGVANVGGSMGFTATGVIGNVAHGEGSGGGIFNSGTMIKGDGGVQGNEAPTGGGIYLAAPGSLELEQLETIFENRATGNGGGIYIDGPALLVIESGGDVEIRNNVADADGDGVGAGGGIFHTGLAEGSVIPDGTVFDNEPDDISGPLLP